MGRGRATGWRRWRAGASLGLALLLAPVPLPRAASQEGPIPGQSAPADAYREGSPFAYYGSENEWSRRMFSAEAADRYYKRRGQRQLLAILDGHPRDAVAQCRQRLEEDPEDLESLFVLTLAWARLGEVEEAVATARRALEAGLPPGRFLAGPRDLLQPLAASAAFRELLAGRASPLVHGPMLGAMSDRAARVWVRTADEAEVGVRLLAKGSGSGRNSATARSRRERDFTAVVELSGLEPDTVHTYEVLIDGKPMAAGEDERPTLRTFPEEGRPARFRVAFGGGAGYTPPHERMWETIAARAPAALLLLGDNVYIDLPEHPGAFHRYTYYRRQSRPEFRALVRSVPVFAIWDDHDAAIDDVWLGPHFDRPGWKLPMLELFRENWNNPPHGDERAPGCWFRFSIADVDFFMLDGRFYRTNPFAERPTMLGPIQKAWLLDGLARSRATFKVVVSPVPWALEAKPGSRDTWNGYREERAGIFGFLAANRIDGVLLLSADRHRSEAWQIARAGAYPLYELSSSRLTNVHRHAIVPGPLFSYNEKCSFGLVTFDTTRKDPEVEYQAVNIDGEVVGRLALKRSGLVHAPLNVAGRRGGLR